MTPLGSRTKNRRTPHGSSVRGYTIEYPCDCAAAWQASTSATSTLISACGSFRVSDATTLTWAARTLNAFTLATPYTVVTSGVHYASVMVTATAPTLQTTAATSNALVFTGANFGTGAYDRCVTSGSSLTGTAPSTIATTTVVTTIPYVAVF